MTTFIAAKKNIWHPSNERNYRLEQLIDSSDRVAQKKETLSNLERLLQGSSAEELIAFSKHVLENNNQNLCEKIVEILAERMLPWTEC